MNNKKPRITAQHNFGTAIQADINRSTFLRNSIVKTTFNCGKLVPIYIDEILPGDTYEIDLSAIARMTTPIYPTMDNLDLDFYAFFVPNRLVWDKWEELMGENKTSAWTPQIAPAPVPMVNSGVAIASGTIADYYGLPIGMTPNQSNFSILPFRGYNLIYNDWFRDENLQAPATIQKGSYNFDYVSDQSWTLQPYRVNKKADYFTSCLPSPQKGESQLIPIELNELIPVIAGEDMIDDAKLYSGYKKVQFSRWDNHDQRAVVANGKVTLNNGGTMQSDDSSVAPNNMFPVPRNLYADGRGQQISGSTISDLRTAFQIQKLFERDARGGTRYIEMLKSHFGVEAEDYRLQRPEYLGHIHQYVGMQQVAQTSSTNDTSPQGNLSAYSQTIIDGQKLLNKSFVEHGFLHIFAVARQQKTYQQGLEKFWSRKERLDYYFPVLANISEQPILNKEIYALNATAEVNDEIFGYQEAWADYRYKPNRVTGNMRSGIPNSLDVWHYADYYTSKPVLSADWIKDNSQINVDRTLAVQSTVNDQILLDCAICNKATRAMPITSIPGLVDHF